MLKAATILRDARRSAGLTQAALASQLGVPQSVVSRWETEGANPRWETVNRVLAACGRDLAVTVTPTRGSIDPSLTARMLAATPEQRLRSMEVAAAQLRSIVLVGEAPDA